MIVFSKWKEKPALVFTWYGKIVKARPGSDAFHFHRHPLAGTPSMAISTQKQGRGTVAQEKECL
jgi:hypothetical protein